MQYKSKTRKLKFNIPNFGLQIPQGKELVGIDIVIEDFFISEHPSIVLHKLFPVADLVKEENSYAIVTDILLTLDTALAMKYRFAFNDPGSVNEKNMIYSEYSIPTSFYGDQEGVKLEGLLVLTPILKVEECLNMVNGDILKITGSEFTMPIGMTKHKYTNWKVYDANDSDEIIFQRRMDRSNLTTLELDLSLFLPTNLYVIECSYVSEDNVESLTGRYYYNRIVEKFDVVEVKPITPFYIDHDWYFKVHIQSQGLDKIGFKVYYVDENGKDQLYVKLKEQEIRSSIKVPSGIGIAFEKKDDTNYEWGTGVKEETFNKECKYRAFYYLIKEDGTKTDETLVAEFDGVYESKFTLPETKVNYPGKYTAMWPIETGDFICSSQELLCGIFMLGNYKENTISFFKRDSLVLRDLGFKIELPDATTDESGFPIFSVYQGRDGFIYINYPCYHDQTTDADKIAKRSAWLVGKINPVTYEFKTYAIAKFQDEIIINTPPKGTPGIDGIYYIPNGVLKDPNIKTADYMNTAHLVEAPLFHIRPVVDDKGDVTLTRTKLVDKLIKNYFTDFVITDDDKSRTDADSKNYYILAGRSETTNKLSDVIYKFQESVMRPVWENNETITYPSLDVLETEDKDDNTMKVRNGRTISKALIYHKEFPGVLSISELGSVSLYPRGDGSYLIFNDSIKGKYATNSASRVVNIIGKVSSGPMVIIESNDMKIDLPFTNTVQLRNGGFIRLTSNLEGMKSAIYYAPQPLETYHDYEVKANDILIVRRNEKVKVTDLTKYSKVEIQGDTLDNTGKLTLIDNGTYKHFDFRDLIITRDTTVTEAENALIQKHRLYLLPGVKYEITK